MKQAIIPTNRKDSSLAILDSDWLGGAWCFLLDRHFMDELLIWDIGGVVFGFAQTTIILSNRDIAWLGQTLIIGKLTISNSLIRNRANKCFKIGNFVAFFIISRYNLERPSFNVSHSSLQKPCLKILLTKY